MKKLALALATSLLFGCATHNPADVADLQPEVVYQSLATLNYSPLNIYDGGVKYTAALNQESTHIRLDGNESAVLGWKIPAYGAYRFKLISQIDRAEFGRKASAFMAEVRLLDKDFKVIKNLPATALEYQKPGLMTQEYFYHNFVVDNRDPLLPPIEYMVVLMNDLGRQHQIMVVDQEKEYAKVRGTMPPMTDDIWAMASESGTIILEATALMAAYLPASAPAPAYEAPVQTGEQKSVAVANQLDTVAISRAYREEIKKLLDSGDVATALKMREQLDALQQSLQADFATLYKRGGGTTMAIANPTAIDLTEQLSAAYRNQLIACFKAGDMTKALGLLDQAKGLQQHVDALFRLPKSS